MADVTRRDQAPACDAIAAAVVVPSFNRRGSLLRLLDSLDRQTLDPRRYEVVVVDNNSTDATSEAVEAFARRARARLRCVREPAQGAAHARNRGIRETSAPVVAFTDDDASADPRWLEELLAALQTRAAAGVGGRTLPAWDAALPPWWLPEYDKAFVRNWGDTARPVAEFPFFYSVNLALRRDVFARVGVFETRLGPTATAHVVGEDADLCRRVHEAGGSLVYWPPAIVHHHVEATRLTRRFLRRRFYYSGVTHAAQRVIRGGDVALAYHAKELAGETWRWLLAPSATERLRRELALWYRAGVISRSLSRRGRG